MTPRLARSALFFLALGVGWAGALSSALRIGAFPHDAPLGPALYVGVPLATLVVGLLATRLTATRRRAQVLFALLAVPFAGLVMGVTIGLVWWPPHGVRAGAHDGFFFGLGAAPVVVAASHLLSSAARPGSIVDRSERWLAASIAGALVAASSLLTVRAWGHHLTQARPELPLASLVGLAVASLAIVGALGARRRAAAAMTNAETSYLDLGVGDARTTIELPRTNPYRDGLRATTIHGDHALARSTCDRNAIRVSVAFGLALLAVVVRIVA